MRERERERQTSTENELESYFDSLWERIPNYAKRAATIKPGEEGSVEWLSDIGSYWKEARKSTGLTRQQMADTKDELNKIRFFEVGAFEPDEMLDMPLKYTTALNQPQLLEEFYQKFNFPKPPQKNP